MPRIFRHYVSYYLLALLAMEGWIIFASTFAILHVPRVGFSLFLDLLILLHTLQVVLFGKGSR